ncbi:MAG: type IV secretion system DNA-binding domain-containing protein [Candidatus Aenigmatarchaeota archaeon]
MNYLIFTILSITGCLIIFSTIWLIKKHKEKVKLRLSLNYSLLLIELPKPIATQTQQDPKIRIIEELTSFENFLNSFYKIKQPIVFEVTVPHYGEKILFYAAVPKKEIEFFRKVVLGFSPGASISLVEEDYNVFNPKGKSLGSIVKLVNHDYLPIKTYKELALSNVDPLDTFLAAFLKLSKEGEGLAWQIVLKPASTKENKKILGAIKKLREGKHLSEALEKGSLLKDIFKILQKEFLSLSEDKKKNEEEEKYKPKPIEESAIKNLEFKASKPLFEVNIRLVVSTPNEFQSDQILSSLETPFHQFVNPGFNEFRIIRLKKTNLEKMLYKFSFRLFEPKHKILLNTEEITSFFHLPTSYIKNPIINWLKAKSAPPPPELPHEGIILGENIYQGVKTTVRITRDDRRRHIYIIGQTGTGKTTLLKNMVSQDIKNGDGVCFIDPHGDVAEEIMGLIPEERINDVIYFNPGYTKRIIGLNILEYTKERPEDKTKIVNYLLEIIDKLYNLRETGGPLFEQYFRYALLLIMYNPDWHHTLLEVPRVFIDEDFRSALLDECDAQEVVNFWRGEAERVTSGDISLPNVTPYITSKLNPFVTNEFIKPIIGQAKSSLNFSEIMNNQKILIVNLSKGLIGETSAYLLGMIIISKILMAAYERTSIPEEERKDFYLYIDEFQNFAFKSVATILSEARKYRLAMVLANQYIKQLPEEVSSAIIGNVGTIIALRVGSDDGEFFERIFTPVFNKYDLTNIPNFNAYIKLLIHGYTSEAFNIKTLPPEPYNKDIASKVISTSLLKYGRSREDVDEEIKSRYALIGF